MDKILWIAAIVIFSIIELNTFNMVTIWFVTGSVAALISSLFGIDLIYQLWIFTIVTIISLIVTKPIVKKKIAVKKTSTNADRIIGMKGIVTESITNDKFAGKVKVNGQEWSAISVDGTEIKEGKTVTVENIEGVKLIVNL